METQSVDWFRTKVDKFENGNALFREMTGRDYGIDGIIELFDNGIPTGKIALVQIKGTSKTIAPMVRTPELISCKISSSSALYTFQKNIPVLLVYISLNDKNEMLYFADIRSIITDEHKRKMEYQDEITVKIPVENLVLDDMKPLFEVIHSYY